MVAETADSVLFVSMVKNCKLLSLGVAGCNTEKVCWQSLQQNLAIRFLSQKSKSPELIQIEVALLLTGVLGFKV